MGKHNTTNTKNTKNTQKKHKTKEELLCQSQELCSGLGFRDLGGFDDLLVQTLPSLSRDV